MTIQDVSLFKALATKMDYLGQRQRVISQNIANSDTPNYRPQDLKEADFSAVLGNLTQSSTASVKPVSMKGTNAMHMGAGGSMNGVAKESDEKNIYEAAPMGNAVIVEEQMLNAGEVMMDYNMMTNLYSKNINLIRMAVRGSR